jgi:hypothetical protein
MRLSTRCLACCPKLVYQCFLGVRDAIGNRWAAMGCYASLIVIKLELVKSMVEVRSLRLTDLPVAYKLAKNGGLEDPVFARVHRLSRVGMAMFSLLPGVGVGAFSFVSKGDDAGYGLIQVRKRWDGYNADLMFLSPMLRDEHDRDKWQVLLNGAARELKEKGTVKLYARVPSEGPEKEVFLSTGFQLYAEETLLELPPRFDLPKLAQEPGGVYLGCNRAHLHNLYTRVTPLMVQRWESTLEQHDPPGWDCFRGHVVMWFSRETEPLGAIYIEQGARGALMQAILVEPPPSDSKEFVVKGLSMLWNRITPCYALVRSYQPGLKSLLLDIGFEERACFTAAVRNIALPELAKAVDARRAEAGNGVIAGLTPTRMNMDLQEKRVE